MPRARPTVSLLFSRGGRFGMRTLAISAAERRYVIASRMKATSVPKYPVTTPPIAAPIVSIADQVTEEIAFAATSSRSETIEGMIAVLAGSKKVESASCTTVRT